MRHLSDDQLQLLVNNPEGYSEYLEHLEQCMQCQKNHQSMLQIHQSLFQLEYQKPSMRFAKNIYEIIVRKQQLEKKEYRWIRIIQGMMFSAVFLVLSLGSYFILSAQWAPNLDESSFSLFVNWSLAILSSTALFLLLYVIESWISSRNKKEENLLS